jgi:alanyl-tRNA synthetase
LHKVLGAHARQAGSLVAPDHLRFDFTHPMAVTADQLEEIEADVNRFVLGGYPLKIDLKPLQQAISEGATALFGEKYGEIVRNIRIAAVGSDGAPEIFSNELCGGTHVDDTGDIGLFLVTSESSAAAGIRRIEAVTGRGAYVLVQQRLKALKQSASLLDTHPEDVPARTGQVLSELDAARRELVELRRSQAVFNFNNLLENLPRVKDVPVLAVSLADTDADTLRHLTDTYRQRYPSSVAVLASVSPDGKPVVIAAVTDDLLKRGLNAIDLVKFVGGFLGGGGGGRPTLAQAGGKDAARLPEALERVNEWVSAKLK